MTTVTNGTVSIDWSNLLSGIVETVAIYTGATLGGVIVISFFCIVLITALFLWYLGACNYCDCLCCMCHFCRSPADRQTDRITSEISKLGVIEQQLLLPTANKARAKAISNDFDFT